MDRIAQLERMLASGQDNALLRYGLGDALLKAERIDEALLHLKKAVELQPDYSAAWKIYGKALTESGDLDKARQVYQKGIEIAQQKGDVQAAKEMQVFLKRLDKIDRQD